MPADLAFLFPYGHELGQRHRSYLLAHSVRFATCMNNGEPVESKISERVAHAGGDPGSVGSLDLVSLSALSAHDEKIKFGAIVGSPEEALVLPRALVLDDFPECEPFPRSTQSGMDIQGLSVRDPQQSV